MSAEPANVAVERSHRSILPNIPGVPWWAAVLIATTATAVGYVVDAGHKELTHAFAGLYIAGCVAAVLAVRQSGVFTAVIQPPLILFCAVPGAYWLFHGGKVDKFKDLLINCGYPLIERFPLMLGTAGGVLLIGLIRWYFGMNHRTQRSAATTKEDTASRTERTSVISGIIAKVNGLLARDSDETADETGSQPAHAIGRSPRSKRAPRNGRSAKRPTRTRSRHARPPLEDQSEPTAERQRQQRRQQTRRGATPTRNYEAGDPPRRSRRPRPPSEPDLRAQPPREMRRDPHARRSPYERPRSSRFDPYDGYEPPEPSRPAHPYNRRYVASYEPYEHPYESRRGRTAPTGPNSANPTHHPISQVRYRGSAPRSEPRADRQEPRADRRGQSRTPRKPQAESWEYDV
ncbi:DUF6542 domain-containing protein [Mycobacterium simulans]|uniref:DUF6542 domain-containing protein n=1 Tax=Mycobacterium simulans TaxID=627089 RepID=UPI00174CF6A3|nr:DUF6542 domain-containing protein [Mycobacterium simulans]